MCRALDEQVELFRRRPLEGAYPYLWLDAKQVKVRDHGRVVSKAVVVAYAVHESGVREVIGLDVGEVESGAFWVEFLRSLKQRGLDGVRLAISDQHEGLKGAIARVLGCPWQRCTVHFTRDMVMHCRRDQRGLVAAALREIFNAEGYEQAKGAGHSRARATQGRGAEGVRAARAGGGGPARLLPAARQSTGPSSAARIRWSGSTRRSAVAPTSSGSSPTTPP